MFKDEIPIVGDPGHHHKLFIYFQDFMLTNNFF